MVEKGWGGVDGVDMIYSKDQLLDCVQQRLGDHQFNKRSKNNNCKNP